MTPIRHKTCGAITHWYTGERGNTKMSSADVLKLDGTRPKFREEIGRCPGCGKGLWASGIYPANIVRCFDEDIEPDFKKETT